MRKVSGQPFPLGVSRIENRINFALPVTDGRKCNLLIYPAGAPIPCEIFEMDQTFGKMQCLAIENLDMCAFEYMYEIDGQIFVDPYARALSGKKEWGKVVSDCELRTAFYQTEYDWDEDKPLGIPYHEVIAYSLHVRGYTMDSSLVKAKGTFEGLIEKIPYLQELGINQIQCMPIYEFDECKEPVNYWGYGPAYYFVPKYAYSAKGNAVESLKNMVKQFHKAGIEVVLELPFETGTPKQLMIDCIRHYRMEYHIDGFVLNPMVAPWDVICTDPLLHGTKIMKHQTGFKDTMRRFLKGDSHMIPAVMYWNRHISIWDGIFNYVASHSGFTLKDTVSYNEKHNEENGEKNRDGVDWNNSWNCGAEGKTDDEKVLALRNSQIRNAFLLLLLAQGTPCILAGDEFANSQNGNNNVYCQDNETGWVNWKELENNADLFTYVKNLIAFRKEKAVFHPSAEMSLKDIKGVGLPEMSYHGNEGWIVPEDPEGRELGIYYREGIYVAYNMHWKEKKLALPKLPGKKKWCIVATTKKGALSKPDNKECKKIIKMKPRTIVVLEGK